MLGLRSPRKKNSMFENTTTAALPRGGSVSVGPSSNPIQTASPVAGMGLNRGRVNPVHSAVKEYADQPYQAPAGANNAADDTISAMGGLTNAESQKVKVDLVKASLHERAVTRHKESEAAKLAAANEQQAAGTLTVDSADRLGLLGGRSRYSKDFVSGQDENGKDITGGADGLVAGLNRGRIEQNEADKNRSSAEAISGNKVGLTRGRFETQTFKTGKNEQGVMVLDTMTGNEVPAPGQIDVSGWDPADQAEFQALETQVGDDSSKLSEGKDGLFLGMGRSRRKQLQQNQTRMQELIGKYSGDGAGSGAVPDADILTAIPDATPQELSEIKQLLQQGMTLEEISENF